MIASMMKIIAPCTLSGTLDATAVAGDAESASITVTVPIGNSGQITFNFVDTGTITTHQYKKNADAYAGLTDGAIVTFANGDTLRLKTTGNGAGESVAFTLTDATRGSVIQSPTHTGA